MDLITTIDSKVGLLESRYNELNKQIADLLFYRKCCVEKFVEEAHNYYSMELPYSTQFYDALMNESSENHKRNKKFIQDDIRSRLHAKDAKITSFIWEGYDMRGFNIYFISNKESYELRVPMPTNITCHNVSNMNYDYVNWDIIQFKLLLQIDSHSWKTVWSGYRLADCNYFAENNVEDLPFK